MRTSIVIGLATIIVLMSLGGNVPDASGADDSRPMLIRVLRDKPQDLENGNFLLELSPCYYKYKTEEADLFTTGVLFKVDIGPRWEVSVGSDFLSYQRPDFGLSDIFAGAKWKFYARNDWTLAVSGYVLFPTGDKVFREPGIEPTLTLLMSRTLGSWEIGLSLGSTYAADANGEPNYLDLEVNLEVDYTFDEHNVVSIFASGFGPDQRVDGSPRVSVGTSYTRSLTDRQSLGVMLMKGLSARGMDGSATFIYSCTF